MQRAVARGLWRCLPDRGIQKDAVTKHIPYILYLGVCVSALNQIVGQNPRKRIFYSLSVVDSFPPLDPLKQSYIFLIFRLKPSWPNCFTVCFISSRWEPFPRRYLARDVHLLIPSVRRCGVSLNNGSRNEYRRINEGGEVMARKRNERGGSGAVFKVLAPVALNNRFFLPPVGVGKDNRNGCEEVKTKEKKE